jgi:hypothetical protein
MEKHTDIKEIQSLKTEESGLGQKCPHDCLFDVIEWQSVKHNQMFIPQKTHRENILKIRSVNKNKQVKERLYALTKHSNLSVALVMFYFDLKAFIMILKKASYFGL